MKKILHTILITVVVTVATVGTVDARRRVATTTKDIVAVQIEEASKNAVTTPTKQTTAQLMVTLNPAQKTTEERELIVLKAQESDIKNRIEFKTKEMASIDYGYFGFGLPKETKDKYQEAKTLRYKLETDLKKIQADIDTLKPIIGEERSDALEYALTALKILGIGIVITGVDHYVFEGTGRKYVETKGREAYDMMPNVPYVGREARATRATMEKPVATMTTKEARKAAIKANNGGSFKSAITEQNEAPRTIAGDKESPVQIKLREAEESLARPGNRRTLQKNDLREEYQRQQLMRKNQ